MPERLDPPDLLFADAMRKARESGQPFREALLDVAARPPHYVVLAPIPLRAWLTPRQRSAFTHLRRQLTAHPDALSANEHHWVTAADRILTAWEFGATPPTPEERWKFRRARLAAQSINRAGKRARLVLNGATGAMVSTYTWVAAGFLTTGCLTCSDLALAFTANLLAPVALFAFFLRPSR